MDVGIMPADQFEKTPSPEKEEEELVLDFTDLGLEYDRLQESFADELVEIEQRRSGVAMDLPQFKPGEDGRMMELVSQKIIRDLMKFPPHSKPLPDYSIEALRGLGFTDEEELEGLASSFRALQSARDTQNDIIRQYRANGYAYVEVPAPGSRQVGHP